MNLVFNENLREVLGDLAKIDAGIEQIRGLCRPVLNGENYLSGEEVCKALRITKCTLQQYRDDGLVSFVALPGKIGYYGSAATKLYPRFCARKSRKFITFVNV